MMSNNTPVSNTFYQYLRSFGIATACALVDTGVNYGPYVIAKQKQAGLNVPIPRSLNEYRKLYNGVRSFIFPYMFTLGSEKGITDAAKLFLPPTKTSNFVATVIAGSTAGAFFTPAEYLIVRKGQLETRSNRSISTWTLFRGEIKQKTVIGFFMSVPGYRNTAIREIVSTTVLFAAREAVEQRLAKMTPKFRCKTPNNSSTNEVTGNYLASLAAGIVLAPILAFGGQIPGVFAATEQGHGIAMSYRALWISLHNQAKEQSITLTKLITRGLGWRWLTLTGTVATIGIVDKELEDRLPKRPSL